MKNIKNIGIIIIALIITLITVVLGNKVFANYRDESKYITNFELENWDVGDKMGIGQPSNPNAVAKFAEKFLLYTNYDFYCAERGQGSFEGEFTIEAIVKINSNNTATAENENGKVTLPTTIGNSTSSALKSNWVLKNIVYEARQNKNNWMRERKPNGSVEEDGLGYDAYQCAIWQYIWPWYHSVFGSNGELDELGIKNYIAENPTWADGALDYYGEDVIERISAEADSSSDIIVNDLVIKNNKNNTSLETKEVIGKYSVLGPFSYTYEGTLEPVNVYFDDNKNDIPNEKSFIQYNGTTQTTIENIPNGEDFYIKIPTEDIEGKEKINISIKVKGAEYLSATIYFLVCGDSQAQNLMYINTEMEEQEGSITDSYTLNQQKQITIQKQDASGNNLKASGITFEIYSGTTNVGTLTTDANGKATSSDLKLSMGKEYTIKETYNSAYGYKGCTISGATITPTTGTISVSNGEVKVKITEDSTIYIKNSPQLGNLTIEKKGTDGEPLEGVQFVLYKNDKYLKLNDASVTTPIVTSDSGIDITKYSVTTVSTPEQATKFATNSSGKIVINNLEIYSAKETKYIYWVLENVNDNYGYKGMSFSDADVTVTGGEKLEVRESNRGIKFDITNTTIIKITNQIDLGDLKLQKYDEDRTELKLENVGFAIEISPTPENAHAYLALYDKDGNIVPSIKGTSTINRQNIANENEYEVRYYCTDKAISELSDNEKASLEANITTFVTESDGTLTVNNLEVYSSKADDKYTYKLIETTNLNYGYVIDSVELGNITLESNTTVNNVLANKQKYTKLSGYVWIENSEEKANNYDCVYTDGTSSSDTKLTDLYKTNAKGELEKNAEAEIPVEIILRDKITGDVKRPQPDEFTSDGKYTFTDVVIDELENYEVVFVYNGYYYTTVVEQLDKDNGSKVEEVSSEREALNNKFATVTDNGQIVATDGTTNTVEYYKDGHTSTVSNLNLYTTISEKITAAISANTTAAEYNLREAFNTAKSSASGLTQELENINMGIVLREQPKLALGSDIYSVSVDVNSKQYTYYYNGRQQHYNNLNGDEVGVKFEQENSTNRYTRTVYSSDVEAYNNNLTTMGVSLIYKIQITNQSATLTSKVSEIANYFDSDYTIEEIGLSISNNTIGNLLDSSIWNDEHINKNVDVENAETGKSYNSIIIPLSENGAEGLTLEAGNSKYVYIKYKVSNNAIKGLLNEESTYHNATEIMSYSTYYGAETSKVDGVQYITDQTKAGNLYAGIDKSSQPGNIQLKLIDDTRDTEGTKILDTSNYEDDTTSAPALLLQETTSRKISGTIFEDTDDNTSDNEKLGNGIYDSSYEKTIDGVKVELYDAETGEIAKYSDNSDAIATTDGNGNYTFGDENKGVLPGDYIIQFTYNNESYIVNPDGENIYLNVNDYKSTIITSDVIKSAINNETITFEGANYPANRWYTIEQANRYSDAIDNIDLRNTLDNDEVKYSTYQNSFEATYVMKAATPAMDVGIEFTSRDEADALSMQRVETLANIDFGIIERPDVDFTIEKKITALEITTQTGTNIVPKGDPSNPNASMQYVKTGLDGVVPAEIVSDLLQGATLNLEYSITVTNNCQTDYEGEEYYLYGTGREVPKTPKVEKVVDYLDKTMSLDTEKNEGIWTEATVQELLDGGLISSDVKKTLESGNYYILLTEEFNESQEPVKLYATKYLATSSTIEATNRVEIIELSGGRTIQESIPGNYNPTTNSPDEPDGDKVDLIIVSPTGTTVNYILYIIAVVVTFVILVSGIVIIKRRMKK